MPPDPFDGMSAGERRRAQESRILQMVYNPADFRVIEASERPDFILRQGDHDEPFGVEVTNLFPNESVARLNLVHGYHHRLWSGGDHLHKKDVAALQSVRVKITGPDGQVKAADVPAIMTQPPSVGEFRARLCETIRSKSAKNYNNERLSHVNLAILDWHDLEFNPHDFSTDQFFDDDVRAALKECAFREVFLILHGSGEADDGNAAPSGWWYLSLQSLLVMERLFVTGHAFDRAFAADMGGTADLAQFNGLVVDHVSRVQGFGQSVRFEGRNCLHYRGTLAEIDSRGVLLHDHQDYAVPSYSTPSQVNRASPEVEAAVTEFVSTNVLRGGYAIPAKGPTDWLD